MADLKIQLVGDWPAEIDTSKIQAVTQSVSQKQTSEISGSINIKLVDDAEITALNKQYSGNAYATDVLTFSYIENDQDSVDGDLGDVAIYLDRAREQAAQAGTDITTEVALLTLHGILHVLGHDHVEEADREALDKLQAEILQSAGLTYRKFNWE